MRPVFKRRTEHAPDQNATQARAIDEEICVELIALVSTQRRHEAGFRVLIDLDDLSLETPNTASL